MAAIISLRNITSDDRTDIWAWLIKNIKYEDYLIDNISITFINDDDATAYCLRFGVMPATQNPELRKKFKGQPEHVVNFMYFIAQELREIMAELGFKTIDEMVGQVQKLDRKKVLNHYKSAGIDLSPILHQVDVIPGTKLYNTTKQEHHIEDSIEFDIIEKAHPALYRKEKMSLDFPIKNTDRAVGAIISNEISKKYGAAGMPDNTLKLNFTGAAGQSFGAFATKGLTMTVYGNTNDYLGKGLSGAKLVVKVPVEATIVPHDNVITGNVTLYGATAGEAYINGKAGERFCVRNSGAIAVVEGIGDHGCEYMTGGTAVILGAVGRNFGAGMSGGIAYVYDPNKTFKSICKEEGLNLLAVEDQTDIDQLKTLIENHYHATQSPRAQEILEQWESQLGHFIKVFPEEYRLALVRIAAETAQTL